MYILRIEIIARISSFQSVQYDNIINPTPDLYFYNGVGFLTSYLILKVEEINVNDVCMYCHNYRSRREYHLNIYY